jgi:DNA primase
MGIVPPEILEQIRAASDIVEVIGQVLPLKRAGANFVALCPFHKEKTPSFSVNPSKQIFYCFGCHKGGDVFTFIQEYESIGFMEAIRRLGERAGIQVEKVAEGPEKQAVYLKETLLRIHEQAAQRWHQLLLKDPAAQVARDYLSRRQVPPEAIQLFRLGYAPESWDDTVRWASAQGHELTIVERGGLIGQKEETKRYYDRFRGRLMFPICDEQGRVVAFSGRVLSAEAPGGKYINSPETPIFSKGRIFFGLDKAKRSILDAQFAVVCEGQLDLIRCHIAGIQNVVAPQGTALTADHARILKRYAGEVVLCFDADNAGQNAAERSLDSLLAAGLAIRVAVMPAPHDPDSYIQEAGAEAFRRLIQGAPGFFDYYLDRCCTRHNVATDRGRLAVARSLGEALHKTGSAVLIDTYAQKTAQRLGISPDAVRQEFRRLHAGFKPVQDTGAGEPEEAAALAPPPSLEMWLLRLLLLDDEMAGWLCQHLELEWLQHPQIKQVVAQRLEAHQAGQWQGVASWLGQLQNPDLRQLIAAAVSESRPIPQPQQQIADLVRRLRDQSLDRQLAETTRQMADPSATDEERILLLVRQRDLRDRKARPLAGQDETELGPSA